MQSDPKQSPPWSIPFLLLCGSRFFLLVTVSLLPVFSWQSDVSQGGGYQEGNLWEYATWVGLLWMTGLGTLIAVIASRCSTSAMCRGGICVFIGVACLVLVAESLLILPGLGTLELRFHPTFLAGFMTLMLFCCSLTTSRWIAGLACVGTLLSLLLMTVLFPPLWCLEILQNRTGIVFSLPCEPLSRQIYLTIDDVPSRHTAEIAALCNRWNVSATFFVIGERSQGQEHVLATLVNSGHGLGNHQWTSRAGVLLSADAFGHEVERNAQLLGKWGRSRWVRPGNGFITKSMIETIHTHNARPVLGDCFSWDYIHRSPDYTARYVLRRVRPGSILVLHDGEQRGAETLAALQQILPVLRERGYDVARLPQ